MARKGKGRIIKGRFQTEVALGALADNAMVTVNPSETVDEKMFALSLEATWVLRDHVAAESPITVGFAHSDYSAAEIEEYIENTGSWSQGDLVGQEIGRRKIRVVGSFGGEGTESELNEGRPVKTPMKWVLTTGDTIECFAYNESGAQLTTGTVMVCQGHIWLKPA